MSTAWTLVSCISIAGAFAIGLVFAIAWCRRVDDRNYGRAEAELHIQALRDFLPVNDLHTVPEVEIYEDAVDAGMRAGQAAR